jgi:hypothetical protein
MKITTCCVVGVVGISLFTICIEGVFASGAGGGSLAKGNPCGLPWSSTPAQIPPTPANQAWVSYNAWATYNSQDRQTPGASASSGKSH